MQAQSLRTLIDRAETREGYIGIGLATGAVALGGLLLAGVIKQAQRKR